MQLIASRSHKRVNTRCLYGIVKIHVALYMHQKNKNISFINDNILNFEYGFLDHNSKPTSKLDESQIKNENFNLTAS